MSIVSTLPGEILDNRGRAEPHYARCLGMLEQLGRADLAGREAFINRAAADIGLHAERLREGADGGGGFRADLFPRILRPAEWEILQAGVLQRAAAFGAYIRDIYNGRAILGTGLLNPEIVFEDPAFHPELHGVPLGADNPVTVGAVDVVRTPAGDWQVLENRLSTPTGFSYVIQLRRILAQALPELFEQLPVHPVASFATRLSEALAGQAADTAGRQPLVVLVSEGEGGRHFFEESFLARHMGIPLARTGDFVVRDGMVFLKTIQGLLRVDVIYRRVEPDQLDPVAFATASESGVPGLVQCARRGTVRIVNAPGCAVADNRALLRYSDVLIRHYTGEQPVLRTVRTYHGFDVDQKDWIVDHADQLVLKTLCHPDKLARTHPWAHALFLKGDLAGILARDPRLVVAQQLPEVSRLPVYRNGGYTLGRVMMRVFFITGPRPYVLPGGLTRVLDAGRMAPAGGAECRFLKDTWALRERRARTGRSGRLEPSIGTAETPLPSRAADAFYWMGRYLERGRGTARMLNTIGELRWSELAPGERELYAPLLRAVMAATGQKPRGGRQPRDPGRLALALLADPANPASVRSCLDAVRYNASGIRSFITPEFWRALMDAGRVLPAPAAGPLAGTAASEALDQVVGACDRLYGAGQRTLLHDAGWHFLNIGLLLERAVNHVTLLAGVLPHMARRQWEHLRDDTDLTALLRLLGALDAYHRRYRSRAYLDRVAQLVWQSPVCSASVLFATTSILHALDNLQSESGGKIATGPLAGEVTAFNGWLANLALEEIFPARAVELDRGLTRGNAYSPETVARAEQALGRMQHFLETLHGRLEDTFFSHLPGPENRRR